jgi:cytochrome c oxidase assembly protein subunit 15
VIPGPLRNALWVTALLVLIVIAASAFIRLSQGGLDCAEWPACYANQSAAVIEKANQPAVADSAPIAVARGIHRITATVVGILLIGTVLLGWDKFKGVTGKCAALAAIALTAFLAWLGRYTPSDLPAVVLGNMLGGMILFGLLWSLAGGGPEISRHRGAAVHIMTLVALALQMALGGMLSARRELLSCPTLPSCNGSWWPARVDGGLFNPLAINADVATDGAALVLAHRFGAVVIALLVGGIALSAIRAGGRAARAGKLLFVLLAVQGLLGASLVLIERPLPLAVSHNFCAALLLATLVSLLWPKEKPVP